MDTGLPLCVALRTTAKEVIFMRKIKKQFTDSLYELKELRTLVAAAMLLAIIVVLGFYRLQLTDYIRIGFDSVAKELTGMLFGPVIGCMVGGLSDLISYIVKPIGGFFPGFTISAMAGGTIYGIILYKRPLSIGRIILANSVVAIVVNLLLNTYWLTLLYGDAYLALLPARAVKQLVMLPIDIILFYITAKLLARTNIFEAVRSRVRR
jgi:ECF transporter S component (folate family)